MDTREAYKEKVQAQIDLMARQLDELRDGATRAVAEAREELTEAADALEEKRDAAIARMKTLFASGDDTWDEIKGDAEELLDEVKDSVGRLFDRFRRSDNPPGAS